MGTATHSNSTGTDGDSGWEAQHPAPLIALILSRYHEPLRRDLPALAERARNVEAAELRAGRRRPLKNRRSAQPE